MSRDYVTNTRWCLSGGSTACPINRVKIDEIDDELEHIARFRCKITDKNKSNYLAEKFKDLKVGEIQDATEQNCFPSDSTENLKSCETFTDVSLNGKSKYTFSLNIC